MKVTASALPVLALLPTGVFAGLIEQRADHGSCSTVYGHNGGHKAVTTTIRGGKHHTVTVVPTRTVTKDGQLVTVTVTKHAQHKKHQVHYVTVTRHARTSTQVVVQKVTSTHTGAASTVTGSATTTVTKSAPSGFKPAAAAVNTAAGKHKAVHISHSKSGHVYHTAKTHKSASHKATHKSATHKPKHSAHPISKRDAKEAHKTPVSVICHATANGKSDATVTAAPVTTTVSHGRRVTKTVGGDKTITRTHQVKGVTTVHSTRREVVSTTTVHSTHTIANHAAATSYAACGADNQLGWTFGGRMSLNGTGSGNGTMSGNGTAIITGLHVGINSVSLRAGSVAVTSDTDTAYDCCVTCQTTDECVGSQWRSGVCTIHTNANATATCDANVEDDPIGAFFSDPLRAIETGAGLVLSNGLCGYWRYGGLSRFS